MFCNDLPRFFQMLSGHGEDFVSQNSCLHGSVSLNTILQKGNGMDDSTKFRTENARIISSSNNNNNSVLYNASATTTIYDFGACTVRQLLFGYDENLSPCNKNEFYTNDGLNPCFNNDDDSTYFDYLQETYAYNPPKWQYVIMNDNTVYPGNYQKRQKSLRALQNTYASMFLELGSSIPVFLVTHGYERLDKSFAELGNVSEFTSRIHYGYKLYADAIAEYLPKNQTPILAPVGLAFLTLYEENYNFWKRLFFYDGFHPSAHGTYLMGCVLFASLFGRMPSTDYAFPLGGGMQQLWSKARKMQLFEGDAYPTQPIPTIDEATYLFKIAKRVVLQGHVPKTLLTNAQVEALEAEEMAESSSSYG